MKKLSITCLALVSLSLSACSGTKKCGATSGMNDPLNEEFVKAVGSAKVYFAYDSAALTHSSQDVLKKQAEWLVSHPEIKATVEGHCDERGTVEYNLALGEKRANSTKHFLAKHGVPAARITTISYGKEKPEVTGAGEEAWSKNRRSVTEVAK